MVKFVVPLYGETVKLFSDRKEFTKACEKVPEAERTAVEECRGMVQPITASDGSIIYLVGVFDKDPITLVHECAHVAIFIAEHIGWDINVDTSEPFCYLLEELVKRSQIVLTA